MKFNIFESIKNSNNKKNEVIKNSSFDIEKKEKDIEKESLLFEERYKKELLPVINALCPDDENMEEFEERMKLDLEESLKKIQVSQGKLIEYDENKNFEGIKEILLSRIKAILEDEKKYQFKHKTKDQEKRPDAGLVFRSKIALLLSGDFSELEEYKGGKDKFSMKKLDFESLKHYLFIQYEFNEKKKLSEKELNELVKAGFGKQLAKIQGYEFAESFENVPESLFLELIDTNSSFWLDNILEKYPSKRGYNYEVAKKLISKNLGYLVLKNLDKFKDSNINQLKFFVMNYNPEYPYHIKEILDVLTKLRCEENFKKEILDFTFKHQFVTDFEEISKFDNIDEYKKKGEEIKDLYKNTDYGKAPIESLSVDKIEKIKKYIDDGYITFLHSFYKYIEYFSKNDYKWFRDQLVKNNQDNLCLELLRPEDQWKYAQKLINQNDMVVLQELFKQGRFLKDGLSKEIYQELFYFKNFSNEPEFKKKEITQLIEEAQAFYENESMVIFYVNIFKDFDNFDESVSKNRKQFFEEFKKNVSILVKNKPILIEDKRVYIKICEEVYPKRNYDTYQYIDQYKDRSEDLDTYTFDKNGYQMRLSGVVGYKIKDGQTKDENILVNYKNRIKNIDNLAQNNKNMINFISRNLPETESKTLEGKIIEYIRKNRNDSNSIDLLLAYQLHGNYDRFVRESVDRTDMYEKMEGKEYVMLSELSERYGDLMKETLKEIGKKINNSEDKKLFIKDNKDDIKKGEELSHKIFNEFSKIPEDKLTTEAIQKKVAKSLKSIFQNNKYIKNIAETFSGSFTKENLSNFENIFKEKIDEIFQQENNEVELDVKELEIIRQKTYEEIKNELNKYEEIKEVDENKKGEVKMSKERLIKGYFSKNRENAHARMVGDVCIAMNPKMLENKNYFEFVFFDESRKKCVGTTMLLKMEEPEDKKYLLYCPNPSVDLVSQVSAEKLYKLITKEIINFAKENKFDGILVNKTYGHATNRSGLFQTSLEKSILHDEKGGDIVFNLKNKHELSTNYIYQNNLNVVWLK